MGMNFGGISFQETMPGNVMHMYTIYLILLGVFIHFFLMLYHEI